MSQAEARGEGESARDEQYENALASIISGALVDCGDAVVPSWEACLYVARRVLSVAPPAAQPPDAKPVTTERLREMFEDYREAWSPGARDELLREARELLNRNGVPGDAPTYKRIVSALAQQPEPVGIYWASGGSWGVRWFGDAPKHGQHVYVAPPSAAQIKDAKAEPTLICPKCGVDRFKSACGNASHIMTCPLQGVALALPAMSVPAGYFDGPPNPPLGQPPAGKSNKITDEEIDQISWDELPDRIRQGPGELLNQLQDACRIIVRKAFDAIDAIPREIHDRLVAERDADVERQRECISSLRDQCGALGTRAEAVERALADIYELLAADTPESINGAYQRAKATFEAAAPAAMPKDRA